MNKKRNMDGTTILKGVFMKILTGIGMILVGILFPAFWISKRKTPLKPFLVGALLWIICVAAKFAVAIPFNQKFFQTLLIHLPPVPAQLIYYTYVGLLTGIFECGLLYIIIKQTSLRFYNFDSAVAFGIGFGSVEAIAVGLKSFMTAIITGNITFAGSFVPYLYVPAPIVERFFTVFGHLFCALLIFYAIKSGRMVYFFISLLFKTFNDALAAWFIYTFMISLSNIWGAELIVALFGTIGFYGCRYLSKKYDATNNSQPAALSP